MIDSISAFVCRIFKYKAHKTGISYNINGVMSNFFHSNDVHNKYIYVFSASFTEAFYFITTVSCVPN